MRLAIWILALLIAAAAAAAWMWWPDSRGQSAESVDDAVPLIVTPRLREQQQEQECLIDPAQSGWLAEAVAEEVNAKLSDHVAAHLKNGPGSDPPQIASDNVAARPLRPAGLATIRSDELFTVRRWREVEAGSLATAGSGLTEALDTLLAPYGDGHVDRVKIKTFAVEASDAEDTATTTVRFESFGRNPSGAVQQTAHWQCHWRRQSGKWLLTKIQPTWFEEVESPKSAWFDDCTAAALAGQPAFDEQLRFGLHHWLVRVERFHGMRYFQQNGLAVGDVDGDGLDDLYVCQPGGLPNRLFLQQADGTAKDVAHEYGVDWLDDTASALLVDLDNDGDQDLALATFEGLLILANDAGRKFQRRLLHPLDERDVQSLSAVDYDNDGDLDLYLTIDYADGATVARRGERMPRFRFEDANDGGRNLLLSNEIPAVGADAATWPFIDVTTSAGLDENNRRHSLAAAWEDYDNDGDQDLYVANDYGQNCLYRNDDGRFTEVAAQTGAVDQGAGMSVSWGDVNRDGRMDLYIGNMYSFAGNRLTAQTRFLAESSDAMRAVTRRFAKGNTLLLNSPDGEFTDAGGAAGVEMGRWAWGAPLVDINNDGWEDIIVANGYLTTPDTGDL